MTRAYAIAFGTGAQSLLGAAWLSLVGEPGPQVRALLMGAGWVTPLAVVQWQLSAGAPRSTQPPWSFAT